VSGARPAVEQERPADLFGVAGIQAARVLSRGPG